MDGCRLGGLWEGVLGGGDEVRRVVFAVLGDAAVVNSKETGDDDDSSAILRSTPVFLSHGTDDAFVSVDLGREATRYYSGLELQWNGMSLLALRMTDTGLKSQKGLTRSCVF